MMQDNLQTTLNNLLQSKTQSNLAFNSLLNDYAKYHMTLVIVGGLFVLTLLVSSIFFWVQYQKASKTNRPKWTFEKKSTFFFGLLTTTLGLLMALIVMANVSNVFNPRQGFSGIINELGTSHAGTKAELHQSFNTWLHSSSTHVPSLIQSKINNRLAWQQPKAIICSFLLVLCVMASVRIWGRLIGQSRARETLWKFKEKALLFSGVVLVPVCLMLMLMVIGNTQASFASFSLTMLYG